MSEAQGTATIRNEIIHFRPLARLKDLGRQLNASILLTYCDETLSIESIMGIAAWELEQGSVVQVTVRSEGDVNSVLQKVISFIEGGCGE